MSFLMGLNFHATDLTHLDPRISAMVGECCKHHDGHVVLIEMVWSFGHIHTRLKERPPNSKYNAASAKAKKGQTNTRDK